MTKKPQILFKKDNPLITRDVEVLEDCNGKRLPAKPVMALCRCGESESQPFCDGKHLEKGFRNETNNYTGYHWKAYQGEKITVYFDLSICSHSAVCLNQLPTVFDTRKRPWINPDGATWEEIIKTVKDCPSGALKYILREEIPESSKPETKISLVKGGPYNVQGDIELCGETCPPADPERYCLCRCGRSGNTPFCDGRHWRFWHED